MKEGWHPAKKDIADYIIEEERKRFWKWVIDLIIISVVFFVILCAAFAVSGANARKEIVHDILGYYPENPPVFQSGVLFGTDLDTGKLSQAREEFYSRQKEDIAAAKEQAVRQTRSSYILYFVILAGIWLVSTAGLILLLYGRYKRFLTHNIEICYGICFGKGKRGARSYMRYSVSVHLEDGTTLEDVSVNKRLYNQTAYETRLLLARTENFAGDVEGIYLAP